MTRQRKEEMGGCAKGEKEEEEKGKGMEERSQGQKKLQGGREETRLSV